MKSDIAKSLNQDHRLFCDACKEPFTPKLKEKRIKDGGAKQWFSCPHCQAKYPVCKITRKGLELRARLQSYAKSSPGFRKAHAQVIADLQEEMKREVVRASSDHPAAAG